MALGLLALTCTPDTVGVLTVEDSPVLPRIGYVVAHPGQPLEGVEGLEVTPERRVHPGAVEDGLLAVEVDELPERERVAHDVSGGVLEALLVLWREGFADVCGEAGIAQTDSHSAGEFRVKGSVSSMRSSRRRSAAKRVSPWSGRTPAGPGERASMR